MKKNYIQPAMLIQHISTNNMLATSFPVSGDHIDVVLDDPIDGGEAYVKDFIWEEEIFQ